MNKTIGADLQNLALAICDLESYLHQLNQALDKKHGTPPNKIGLLLFDGNFSLGKYEIGLYDDRMISAIDTVLQLEKEKAKKELTELTQKVKELLTEEK